MGQPENGATHMRKKRPNLADFQTGELPASEADTPSSPAPVTTAERTKPVHKSVYIPPVVLEQLDLIAMQERPAPGRKKKFNTLILEGIDLLLRDRGLPSIEELTRDV
jgi:hypothetical protein